MEDKYRFCTLRDLVLISAYLTWATWQHSRIKMSASAYRRRVCCKCASPDALKLFDSVMFCDPCYSRLGLGQL